jgi:hypothetical protein
MRKVERETGFVIPGTKTRIEFAYRLINEDADPVLIGVPAVGATGLWQGRGSP